MDLLKTALLLWDRLKFIVSDPSYKPHYEDPLVAEAVETIGESHYPTDDERAQADGYIEDFVTRALPPPFYYKEDRIGHANDYEVYPQKLLYETWQMLRHRQLAGPPLANLDYPLNEPSGLCLTAILADCCAGETLQRVTDRSAAYATLTGLLGATSEKIIDAPRPSREQLVPITLELADSGNIELKRLVAFRKREEKTGGHAIRDLRHRYLERIELCVKTLTTLRGKSFRSGGDQAPVS